MIKRSYSIIGGDLRNIKLAEALRADGNEVKVYGFDKAEFAGGFASKLTLPEVLNDADIIIGPTPCSNDEETLHCPFCDEKHLVNDVFKIIRPGTVFISGRISDKFLKQGSIYNFYMVDILSREEMAVLNAIPTAEGAIQIALEESPVTIHHSKVFIFGFGRISKILSKMLHGIGADVYVAVRKYSDEAYIAAYGFKPVLISEVDGFISKADFIFNTVPSKIINKDIIKNIKKDCLIIDLASKPGGIDFDAAAEAGLNVIWALSLPGKVAPVTAAKYMKETIYNILEELGV